LARKEILKGSVVFVGSKREVTLYSAYNFLIESKKEDGEACRRPFCPMAEFALAREVPAAKLTDEMHAQGHPYFRVSADAGRSGEGAGHCCIPVGTDVLQLADDGSPVQPLPETSTFLCGKPALRK